MISVGLIQADIVPHALEDNFQHYAQLLSKNISKPIDLLVFPEMFACGFSPDLQREGELMGGPSTQFLLSIANQYQADVVASIPICEEGNLYNRLLWISPEGIRGQYDKKHLFLGEEFKNCTAGDKRTIIETMGYKFLPLICFDVRFPKWSRNDVKDNTFAYDCLIYIANFPAPREQILIKLAQARAIENQAFVITVNRIGTDGCGFHHQGGTTIISPEGEILAQAENSQEQVLLFDLDLSSLKELRQRFLVADQWD